MGTYKKKSQSFNWDSKVVVLGLIFTYKLKLSNDEQKFNKRRSHQISVKNFDYQSIRTYLLIEISKKIYSTNDRIVKGYNVS